MEEEYAPEGYYTNAQPILSFDKDASESEESGTLGNSLSDTLIEAQLQSGVDYQGVFYLLLNFGYTKSQAHAFLVPQSETSKDADVSSNSWNVEFRRPTNVRLYSHAYEWAGYNNYSKALPQYQGELSPNNKFTFYFTSQDGGKVYASGFNEEGLTVTPRGLEDLTTGQVLGLEEIGNPDRDIDFPTSFTNLQVTETLNVEGAEIIGLQNAKTNLVGGGEIASAVELRTQVSPSGSDAQINTALDNAGANFVTPEGLNYWAAQNNVLFGRPQGTVLYVGADRHGSNPVANDDVNHALPNRVDTPVSFRKAVDWANSNRSQFETVVFILDTGVYEIRSYVFASKANVYGWNHATNSELSSFENDDWYAAAGSDSPADFKAPHFTLSNAVTGDRNIAYRALATSLGFQEDSTLNNVVWWDADRSTREDPSNSYTSVNEKTVAEKEALGVTSSGLGPLQAASIYYSKRLDIRDVIFGAGSPSTANRGGNVAQPGVINALAADASLRLGGVILRGNIGTTALSANNLTESYAHSASLVQSFSRVLRLGLGYGGVSRLSTNITLQDINGNPPSNTNSKNNAGPKFNYVFDYNRGLLPFGQYTIWSTFRVGAGDFCGWDGTFHDGTLGFYLSAADVEWDFQYHDTIWVQANSGAEPVAPAPVGPGEVGAFTVFPELNVSVRKCNGGVDVDTTNSFSAPITL